MKCQNCKLINPDIAVRCDCGYDFLLGKMEEPYYRVKTRIPTWIQAVLAIQIVVGSIFVFGAMTRADVAPLRWLIIWRIVTAIVYAQMVKGEGWARIIFAVMTFPIGFTFLLSSALKWYVRQRSGDI